MIKIRVFRQDFDGTLGLFIADKTGNIHCNAQPIVFEKTDTNCYTPSCVRFDRKEEFQDLFDDLWSMGLRPSARSDEYKAQLETMKDHLNDMRAIVFKEKRNDL